MSAWLRRRVPYTALVVACAVWAGEAAPVPLDDDDPGELVAAPVGATPAVVAPAVAATWPIAGWVVDDHGAPIAGVRVRFRDSALVVETAADGAFRLAPPPNAKTLLLDGPAVFAAEVPWRANPPPRILLARRAGLSVQVTAHGLPVVDAEVQITDGSEPTLQTAHTDLEGRVRFRDLMPGPYELWARRDDEVSPLVRVGDASAHTDDVALALEPAGSITGKLVGDGPLTGATLQLVPLDVDHAVRVATIAPDGKFEVAGVPRGKWRVEARAPGYVDSTDQVIGATGDHTDAIVRLVHAGTVTGTVTDVAGVPVANATIVLRQQGTAAQTHSLDEPRISAHLRWVHPLAGPRKMPVIAAARFGAQRPGTRPAECGLGHCGVDIGNQRGEVIHASADGKILAAYTDIHGEAGRMVAIDHGGGLVTMYMHMDQVRPGLEAGQPIRAGEPLGTIGSTGFALDNPHLHFALTQERNGRTWYLDPEPILRHAVVLPAARALDPVAVDPRNVTAILARNSAAKDPAAQALVTDARGTFKLDDVAPGNYVAVAFAEQLAPGVSGPFAVKTAAATTGIAVTLRPGVMVRGRVLGKDGAIDGAMVTADVGFGEGANKVAMTYTNHAGEFVLRALTGKVTLTVSAPGYGDIDRAIALADTDTQRREDFTLVVENGQLRGQIVAPDGGAAGPVEIRVLEGPTKRHAVSDATGKFAVDRVAMGSYVVELTAADYPPLRARIQSGEWKELRFEQGGGVRVFVRDVRDGAAMPAMRVDAAGPSGATANRLTDPRGVAELRGLVPGEWTIVAKAPGYAPAKRTLAIAPGHVPQDVSIDLARAVVLVGVVRDHFGHRVAGARVSIGGAVTQTDADGNFRLDDAPPGDGVLEAEHDGLRGALPLQLVAGDQRLTLTVELSE
jgi:hypothetical protein